MPEVLLHHDVHGPDDAPALLMGGSLGTTLEMWDAQLPLAERLRLVRFDHRAHGGSPVPPGPYEMADLGRDVLALMDELGIERASYCGLSLGGMVGIWLAANAPERVERLVLMCTAAHMPAPEFWEERVRVVRESGTEAVADSVVERWLTSGFAAEHPEVRADLRAMLAATDDDGYAWCCLAIEHMDQRGDLERIAAPTLVIGSASDLVTPAEAQAELAAAIPGARCEIVSPGAHLVAVEQPEAVNRLVAEHVGS